MESDLVIPWHGYSWLDPIIKQQAAHYGLSVYQHKVLTDSAAEFQELIETREVREDGNEW